MGIILRIIGGFISILMAAIDTHAVDIVDTVYHKMDSMVHSNSFYKSA